MLGSRILPQLLPLRLSEVALIASFLTACVCEASGTVEQLVKAIVGANSNTGLVLKIVDWQKTLPEDKRVLLMPAQAIELLSYVTPREKQVEALMAASATLTDLSVRASQAGLVRSEVVVDVALD